MSTSIINVCERRLRMDPIHPGAVVWILMHAWHTFANFVSHAPLWLKIAGFALVWAKPVLLVCGAIGFVIGLVNWYVNCFACSRSDDRGIPWWKRFLVFGLEITVICYFVCLCWSGIALAVIILFVQEFVVGDSSSPADRQIRQAIERIVNDQPLP